MDRGFSNQLQSKYEFTKPVFIWFDCISKYYNKVLKKCIKKNLHARKRVFFVISLFCLMSKNVTVQSEERTILGSVKYLSPILNNIQIASYQNRIFIKHYTNDVNHIYLDSSRHCPQIV